MDIRKPVQAAEMPAGPVDPAPARSRWGGADTEYRGILCRSVNTDILQYRSANKCKHEQ
jgi:hypothetical protein